MGRKEAQEAQKKSGWTVAEFFAPFVLFCG
jgi:hypothetical protein